VKPPYDIGDNVILSATFTVNGVLTDPTAVACRVRNPDQSVTTITASKTSTGVYTATFTPTMKGEHWYRFEGTGTAKGADEAAFVVDPQRVP
jgi:hypothetical protein